jgi:chemotaxis protein methyltransferase WspC
VTPSAIETVVRERLGLDPAALGPGVLERAVEARMQVRGVTEPAFYALRLITDQVERDALACEMTVPETWFFRGSRALFDRLAVFVAERAADRTPGNAVRILSVPCSTGEEPYSLAIALAERLLTADDFAIDAVDLSERALAKAAAGRYSSFAFREAGADARPVYFRQVDDRWELLRRLRDAVHFRPGNLTEPTFLAHERVYDLVVSRNLFIYLTPDARLRAMANLDRLLALDGLLCVTPGEADRLPPGRFVPEGPAEFGLYRRVASVSLLKTPGAAPPSWPGRVAAEPPKPPPRAEADMLEAARALADSGRLDEARAICELLRVAHEASADRLTLVAAMDLAGGRADEAYQSLRQALYLVPDHPEAINLMIGLCERRGEKARAAALRRRLAAGEGGK